LVALANMSAELDWKVIWRRVGQLNSLEHLIINGHWCLRDATDLPQLKYLESLSIFNYHLSKLLPVIDKFGESNITRLILSNSTSGPANETSLREWASSNPQLSIGLTHLTIDGKFGVNETQLRMICSTFTGLSHLDLKLDDQVSSHTFPIHSQK